jgi:hypothetical protein
MDGMVQPNLYFMLAHGAKYSPIVSLLNYVDPEQLRWVDSRGVKKPGPRPGKVLHPIGYGQLPMM